MHLFRTDASLWRAIAWTAVLSGILIATPAKADWRKELGTFRIGIIEAQGAQYSPVDLENIRTAYAGALGMPVEIFQARDFPSLIDAHASSRIEYAVYTAEAYATAYLSCQCIEPLAAPLAEDGSTGMRTALIVDTNLSLSNLAMSKGIGISGVSSLSTFGVALASFQVNGIKFTGAEPWIQLDDSMSSMIEKFRAALLDGFFVSVPARQSLNQVLGADTSVSQALENSGRKAKAVWLSDTFPFGPHAVRTNLAPEAKTILLKMLKELASTNPDLNDLLLPEGTVAYEPVSHSAYRLALDATKALANFSVLPKP